MLHHHCIISGTGRAGTTFLVELLTRLGLDTGFGARRERYYAHCAAGMEWAMSDPDAPYIIKSPHLCDSLDTFMAEGRYVIDHAFVPVRDLYQAAQSRRDVHARVANLPRVPSAVPGGLWGTANPAHQEMALTLKLYNLMYALARHAIPTTILHFPRLTQDPAYLYRALMPVLGEIDYAQFERGFREVLRPELVHQFPVAHHVPRRQTA